MSQLYSCLLNPPFPGTAVSAAQHLHRAGGGGGVEGRGPGRDLQGWGQDAHQLPKLPQSSPHTGAPQRQRPAADVSVGGMGA